MKVLVSGFNSPKSKYEDYFGENITTLSEDNIIAYSYLFPLLTKTNGADSIKEPRPNALTISFPLSEHARVYRLAPSIKTLLVSIAEEIQASFVYGQKLSDKIKEKLRLCTDINYLEKNSKVDVNYISNSIPNLNSGSENNSIFDDAFDIPELTSEGTNVLFGGADISIPSLIGGQFKSIIKEINGIKTLKEINKNLNTSIDDLIIIFNLLREKGYITKIFELKKVCIVFEDLFNELTSAIEGLKKGKSRKMIEETLSSLEHPVYLLIRYEAHERLSFQGAILFLKSKNNSLLPSELISLFIQPVMIIITNLEKFYGKNMLNNLKKNLLMNLAQNFGLGDIYSAVKVSFDISE
jgi:hypothetical protein